MIKVLVCLAVILASVVSAKPTAAHDELETEAIVTPLDVEPSEVQIVQGQRQPRAAYYYHHSYGKYKYSPILPYYGYPSYYPAYYGYRRNPYIGYYYG